MSTVPSRIRCRHRRRGDGFGRRLATGAAWASGRALRAVRPGPHPRRIARQLANLPARLPARAVCRSGQLAPPGCGGNWNGSTGSTSTPEPARSTTAIRPAACAGAGLWRGRPGAFAAAPERGRAAVAGTAVRHHGVAPPRSRPTARRPRGGRHAAPGQRRGRRDLAPLAGDRAPAQLVRRPGADRIRFHPVRPGRGGRRRLDRRAAGRRARGGRRASGADHHPGTAGALRPARNARRLAEFHPPPGRGVHGPGIYGLASHDGIKVGEHGTGPRVEPATRDFRPDPAGVARLQQYAAQLAARGRPGHGQRHHLPVHHDARPQFRRRPARTDHRRRRILRPRLQVRAGHRRTGRRPGERDGRVARTVPAGTREQPVPAVGGAEPDSQRSHTASRHTEQGAYVHRPEHLRQPATGLAAPMHCSPMSIGGCWAPGTPSDPAGPGSAGAGAVGRRRQGPDDRRGDRRGPTRTRSWWRLRCTRRRTPVC